MLKINRIIKCKISIIGYIIIGLIIGIATTSAIEAAIPTSNGQLNACYNDSSLALRVSTDGSCNRNETAVSWSTNPPLVSALTSQTYNNLDWQYMNLPGENFTGSTFVAPSLSGTNFQGSNFSTTSVENGAANNAVFDGSNFTGATISGTNFTFASFTGSNLKGAILSSVSAENANFNKVNFTNANLSGSDLTSSTFKNATWKNTTCPDNTNSTTDGGTCINNL